MYMYVLLLTAQALLLTLTGTEYVSIFTVIQELFDELEGSRWNSIESANMKL